MISPETKQMILALFPKLGWGDELTADTIEGQVRVWLDESNNGDVSVAGTITTQDNTLIGFDVTIPEKEFVNVKIIKR